MKLFAKTMALTIFITATLFTATPSHADWIYVGDSGSSNEVGSGSGLYYPGTNGGDDSLGYDVVAYAPPSSYEGIWSGYRTQSYQWFGGGIIATPNTTHELNASAWSNAQSVAGTTAAASSGAQVQISGNSTLSLAAAAKTSFNGAVVTPNSDDDPKTVFYFISGSSGSFSYGLDFSLSGHAETTGTVSGITQGTSASSFYDHYTP